MLQSSLTIEILRNSEHLDLIVCQTSDEGTSHFTSTNKDHVPVGNTKFKSGMECVLFNITKIFSVHVPETDCQIQRIRILQNLEHKSNGELVQKLSIGN